MNGWNKQTASMCEKAKELITVDDKQMKDK